MDPNGKWALVTGAGRVGRVGADIADNLARNGANIFLHYRSKPEEAKQVAGTIREYGTQVELVQADLTDYRRVAEIFTGIDPDIVVNNAAIFRRSDASLDSTMADYLEQRAAVLRENWEANALSPLLVTDAAVHRMHNRKEGVIVFVGDAFINRGGAYPTGLTGYAVSKSYIPDILRDYAASYGKQGLRFVGVLNGPIEPMTETPQEAIDHMRKEINLPESRLTPWVGGKAVAQAVEHMIRMDGVNGEYITVDGGRVWTTIKEHKP